MDEYVITDLKQFIAGAIAQQTADIRIDLQKLTARVGGLESRVERLAVKVDDGFSAIADILEEMNARHSKTEAQLTDHSPRIARLEQGAA